MSPQFTLYGNVGSVTSDRVRLLLVDQGFTDYDFVNLDFFKGELKTPEHLERHPWGRVPSISLPDGTHLYESSSICRFLALWLDFPLLPNPKTSTPLEQAFFDQAVSVEESYFFQGCAKISGQRFFALIGLQTDEAIVKEGREQVSSHCKVLDGLLAKQDGEFIFGRGWSLLDILYVPWVQRLISLGEGNAIFREDGDGKGNVEMKKWWNKCMERERVKKFVQDMLTFEDVQKSLEARMNAQEKPKAV